MGYGVRTDAKTEAGVVKMHAQGFNLAQVGRR
jgi:hypothetical protein